LLRDRVSIFDVKWFGSTGEKIWMNPVLIEY
jgi:hypothetical protein